MDPDVPEYFHVGRTILQDSDSKGLSPRYSLKHCPLPTFTLCRDENTPNIRPSEGVNTME